MKLSNYIIKDNYCFHNTTEFYGIVDVGKNTIIEKNCSIGKPCREDITRYLFYKESFVDSSRITIIGEGCYIEEGAIISEGVKIGFNVICSEYTTVGQNSIINGNTKIHYRAQIFKRVIIGANSRIGGFICNDSKIGDNCSIYGFLVHKYRQHCGEECDKISIGSPKIGNNVIVGFNSTIIGGVNIEDNVYIAAGAIVTKNVPSNSIVKNTNQISKWNIF